MNYAAMQAARAGHADKLKALAALADLTNEQQVEYDGLKVEIKKIDGQMDRHREVLEIEAKAAKPVGASAFAPKAAATVQTDDYVKDKSLIIGAMIKMVAKAKGDPYRALEYAQNVYGEQHPVTMALAEAKALNTTTGASGGFVVPPDFVDTIIPLLYNLTSVRKAGALTMPMPNGTMTLPKMTGGSQAYWVGEGLPIGTSQPSFGQIVAVAHKLAALVPVTNDQMRYATPTFDAIVRNDLVQQIALAEDAAFLRGNGQSFMPKGLDTYVLPANKLVSNPTPSFASINTELTQMVTALENANIAMAKPAWIMAPRTKNSLYNLQNTQGLYIYRDEMKGGTLNGYRWFSTNQIPINLVVGSNADTSEIYFADFAETMILESRQLEFAMSTEAMFQDASGAIVSAFQNDMTLIRGIMAEDFQLRRDQAVATLSDVRWGAIGTGT